MVKSYFNALLLSLVLTACGGARGVYSDKDVIALTSNSSISWQPPTTYIDQSPLPLSNISGYRVYSRQNEGYMQLVANISDPSMTYFSMSSLSKGTYHIAVSCYDIYGVESGLSSSIIVNIK